MKKRLLTGITPSGRPHLGNILGAIIPAIKLSTESNYEAFYFISDLHSLITVQEAQKREEYTYAIAAAWLAFGLDVKKNYFYRQSRIPEVCELTWYLDCVTPFSTLLNAHAFKSKSENLSEVTAGLFTYPVLMAADIILYDSDFVPVGRDQKQHVEIARDIVKKFNYSFGPVFTMPDAIIKDDVQTVIGVDGRKMSKSYDNYIDIFVSDQELKKKVMSIQTDSIPIEKPKNPDNCNVFNLYRIIAEKREVETMRAKYLKGGYGYGAAKSELLRVLMEKFSKERNNFNYYMNNPKLIEEKLRIGEEKVKKIARKKIDTVRKVLGY